MKLTPRYAEPPIIAIAGRPADQYAPLRRQRKRLEATLAALDDDEWGAPSRCEGWTVQDVVAHLVGVNAFWRASVAAGLAGTPTRILIDFDPAATPPLMVEPMRALTPAEVLDRFAASNDAFLALLADLDDSGWSTRAESPPGHVPISLLAQHALWDCWVHERDVVLPRGSTPPVEDDEVWSCLRYAAALSPAIAISVDTAESGVFSVDTDGPEPRFVIEVDASVALRDEDGPSGAPCLRGDAVELVEVLSLRAPLPPSAPTEWRRLLGGLATAFDVEPQTT